uniref:(northern house mosquito) hypothetical protein n=1 Tax=Culex pipiens TaxID=7175 RepID=A0A8D8PCH8_CULPI
MLSSVRNDVRFLKLFHNQFQPPLAVLFVFAHFAFHGDTLLPEYSDAVGGSGHQHHVRVVVDGTLHHGIVVKVREPGITVVQIVVLALCLSFQGWRVRAGVFVSFLRRRLLLFLAGTFRLFGIACSILTGSDSARRAAVLLILA